MQTIDVKELSSKQARGESIDLIDVRMPTEYRSMHAECARSVPLETLNPNEIMAERNGSANQPLYVICRGGNRSVQACEKFIAAGFTNVVNVEGGTLAWEKAGLPIIRGKKSFPLIQQVQIAAGMLTLFGVFLGYAVDARWFGLSGFVGAGLLFAGLTGFCPMATLIAKMPWNQCNCSGSC